jgi:plasmid maintenance system antidote protein VapI
MNERFLTLSALAERSGLSAWELGQIIYGDCGITRHIAGKLEAALGIDADFWLRADVDYKEHMLKQREGDQPLPIPNDAPDIQSAVIADIEARRELGIRRYGTALQPGNGRDAMRDLYEELLDACMYIKQVLIERDGGQQCPK